MKRQRIGVSTFMSDTKQFVCEIGIFISVVIPSMKCSNSYHSQTKRLARNHKSVILKTVKE